MRLSSAQIQEIERTVRHVPEVIVRVPSSRSDDFDSVRKHFDHIARHGELGLETDYGEAVRGPGVGRRLMEEMDLDLEEHRRRLELMVPRGRRLPKLVHKIVLSMPRGTPSQGLFAAARNFLREQFGIEHRYAFVLHTDRTHPYVHVVVKAMSERGVRLHIKKQTLRGWRLAFAHHLRERNIAANATERAVRGQIRENKPKTIYHTERRGASTRMRSGDETVAAEIRRRELWQESGKSKLVRTREEVERRWHAIRDSLLRDGRPDLAEEVGRFLDVMHLPEPTGEVACELGEGARWMGR
jgi:Relaxase/Mobilisation nuclease domain